MLRVVAISLTGFKLCGTTPNNMQQHATGCANGHNMYHSNNVESCWPTMLHLFAQGFMAEPKYETGEKNVLYIQGYDDLISTKMCGHSQNHT